jgi:hypothetical protein
MSATTTTLSGGLVWPHKEPRVAARVRASSCAGTSTVSRKGVRSASASGSLLGGRLGSRTSRATGGPSGVRKSRRARRISGESGGGIRRSRARTRIAAAACSAARATKNAAAMAPAATITETAGTTSGPSGSWPTMSSAPTSWAIHAAESHCDQGDREEAEPCNSSTERDCSDCQDISLIAGPALYPGVSRWLRGSLWARLT